MVRSGELIKTFCPVVLQLERPIDNLGPMAGIELPMRVMRQEVPFLDSTAAEAIAEEFQGQLLEYRLANLQALATANSIQRRWHHRFVKPPGRSAFVFQAIRNYKRK